MRNVISKNLNFTHTNLTRILGHLVTISKRAKRLFKQKCGYNMFALVSILVAKTELLNIAVMTGAAESTYEDHKASVMSHHYISGAQ